jgi:hypothetical protein
MVQWKIRKLIEKGDPMQFIPKNQRFLTIKDNISNFHDKWIGKNYEIFLV